MANHLGVLRRMCTRMILAASTARGSSVQGFQGFQGWRTQPHQTWVGSIALLQGRGAHNDWGRKTRKDVAARARPPIGGPAALPSCRWCSETAAEESSAGGNADRNTENAQRVHALKLKRFDDTANRQCTQCWHDVHQCICPAETSEVAKLFPHRIILYMHVKEFGRASNTGSLCQVAFPGSTKVYVAAVPEHEEELAVELERRPAHTIVLYPSPGSISVLTFLERLILREGGAPAIPALPLSNPSHAPAPGHPLHPLLAMASHTPLTIVLIDGTWGQARRLAKKLPTNLTRVKLQMADDDTFDAAYSSPLRQQPAAGRLCSLSAFALLTRELLVDARVEDYLMDLLKTKAEVFLRRHGKDWKGPRD